MKTSLGIVPALAAVCISSLVELAFTTDIHRGRQPADEDPSTEADRLAAQVNAEAANAKSAAEVAKQAAVVANNVAEHSVKIVTHSKTALKHALGALHDARVDSQGLDRSQKESLKKAEAKLREATATAEYGKLKQVKDVTDVKKEQMQAEMDQKASVSTKKTTELDQMKEEVKVVRTKLKKKGGDEQSDKELQELEGEIDAMKEQEAKGGENTATNDEVKAEVERLRVQVDSVPDQQEGEVAYDIPEAEKPKVHELPQKEVAGQTEKEYMGDVKMKPLEQGVRVTESEGTYEGPPPTPIEDKGIDIDTQMPYGDLEPFGREDTAQELTESSVRESDEMVDQLERAEVAEEKRSVFRALTRLRGAAITSFDGVARSQTGNIDEYNKVHKWRKVHPLHHLADEESDISKWAFPDNADLMQVNHTGSALPSSAVRHPVSSK
jgi:hypothetical protein